MVSDSRPLSTVSPHLALQFTISLRAFARASPASWIGAPLWRLPGWLQPSAGFNLQLPSCLAPTRHQTVGHPQSPPPEAGRHHRSSNRLIPLCQVLAPKSSMKLGDLPRAPSVHQILLLVADCGRPSPRRLWVLPLRLVRVLIHSGRANPFMRGATLTPTRNANGEKQEEEFLKILRNSHSRRTFRPTHSPSCYRSSHLPLVNNTRRYDASRRRSYHPDNPLLRDRRVGAGKISNDPHRPRFCRAQARPRTRIDVVGFPAVVRGRRD